MKFCRFDDERLGLVDGNSVRDVTTALDVLPRCSYPLPQHDIFIANLEAVTTRARAVAKDARALPLESVTLLSPGAGGGEARAGAAPRARDAPQPGRQSRKNHRRAGQLSEAPHRGARQPAA